MFWRFSIIASSLPSASPTAGHYPQRSTLHAPRHPRRHPPGPAGAGRAQTLPRWLLPGTNRRNAKDRPGPDLDERPSSFSMSPDGQIHRTNPSFFLARRRPTVDHSPVAGGAQRQWLQACLREAISRNVSSLLALPDYPEFAPGSREVLLLPRPLRTGRESFPSSSLSLHERPLRGAVASVRRSCTWICR